MKCKKKKDNLKSIISLLTCVTILFTIVPMNVSALENDNMEQIFEEKEENEKKEENELENIDEAQEKQQIQPAEFENMQDTHIISTWGTSQVEFDEITGELIIKAGKLVSKGLSQYVDSYDLIEKSLVKKIILEDGVIAPEDSSYLFYNFIQLIDVIGKLDTGNVTNMSKMFYNDTSLINIDVSDWNTSEVNNMSGMFLQASKLEVLDVSNWNTSNVLNMSQMFFNASGLKYLDVKNWDTSKTTNMSLMFRNASRLEFLDVSSWNTSNVVNMLQMFFNSSSLKTLDVKGWNVSKVKNMSEMFREAKSLIFLDVSEWNTASVTDMSHMFVDTSSLESLDVSKWNTENVINMSWMFLRASKIVTLDVSKWDTSKVTNMTQMFLDASSLENLDVSKWNTENVLNMSWMFRGANSLENLNMSNWNTSKVTNMSQMFYDTINLKSLTLGNDLAFNNSVELPHIDTSTGEYTGRWISYDANNVYENSEEFMKNYDGSKPGTYVWEKALKKYRVKYVSDGDTSTTPSEDNISEKSNYTIPDTIPIKDGYIFKGWLSNEQDPKTYQSGQNFTMPSQDVTLTAIWEKVFKEKEKYKVIYDLNGGYDTAIPSYVEHFSQEMYDVHPYTPIRNDYTFKGWKSSYDSMTYKPGDSFIMPEQNVILTAQWEKNNQGEKPEEKPGGGTDKPSKPEEKPKPVLPEITEGRIEFELEMDDHMAFMTGYPDVSFRAGNAVTRAEVAATFANLLKDKTKSNINLSFTDVNSVSWYADSLKKIVELGIMTGYPDGSFRPNEKITRAEFAVVSAKFDKLQQEKSLSFTDVNGHWAYRYISLAYSRGWVSGYPDGTFRPQKEITRAEIATVIDSMLERYADKDFINTSSEIRSFTDLNKIYWAYYNIMEAVNSHDYEKVPEEKSETWTNIKN